MKPFQKLILPLLIIIIAVLIYELYFGDKGMGAFADFDTNNTANKDIVVSVVKDKQMQEDAAAGTAMFYASDKNGIVYPVQAPYPLPDGIETAKQVTLKGHLHKDHFHAVEVKLN